MITMEIDSKFRTEENYYRIKFSNMPYEHWEYGQTALDAIARARHDLIESGNESGELGSGLARIAVYGEWDCAPHHFHNDGTHSHQYGKLSTWISQEKQMEHSNLTPCDSCQTPIATDTHAEEFGLCVACSNDYFNHTCDKCGNENVMNLNPPFTRLCSECEPADN
jgi:hypothetical protein